VIISASRRTDIAAFYSDWFMNRVRQGFCLVPNPFNAKQISKVSLRPEDVDAIVFWSKNPKPMLGHLRKLNTDGFMYFFQFTLNDYPSEFEPHVPSLQQRIDTFARLADAIGPDRVIWRYDPIIVSSLTPYAFHVERFGRLADELAASTRRVVISIVDYYHKTNRRFAPLEKQGVLFDRKAATSDQIRRLLATMSDCARSHGLEIQSCAEEEDFTSVGVPPGSCVDGALLGRLGRPVPMTKDPGQRSSCRCVASRDIGVTDTCLHGCRYCYATRSTEFARKRHGDHDPLSPMLI